MPVTLPAFSSGLKLTRIAVFAMLAQLGLVTVITIKAITASSPEDMQSTFTWMQYSMLLHVAATFVMLVGVGRAIPELSRVKQDIGGLVLAAICFAIATAAMLLSYRTVAAFIDVATDPASSLDDVLASVADLESLKWVAVVKDLAYGVGLYAVVRTVQRSAAVNDQLALRDEAGTMHKAILVMVLGDLLFQVVGGGGIGLIGFLGALIIAVFWIYCHVRLQRFLFNAAYFMNEPHELPAARVVRAREKPVTAPPPPVPRPDASQPAAAPPRPSAPRVVPVASAAPPPAAPCANDSDGPRFLR